MKKPLKTVVKRRPFGKLPNSGESLSSGTTHCHLLSYNSQNVFSLVYFHILGFTFLCNLQSIAHMPLF